MDPLTILASLFLGSLLLRSQQTNKEDSDKKVISKQPQQTLQQKKPINNKIIKCPHCGGIINDD